MNLIAEVDERLIKNNLVNLKQIVFEVTEKCNLNCVYHGFWKTHHNVRWICLFQCKYTLFGDYR